MKYFFISKGKKEIVNYNDESAKPILKIKGRNLIKIVCNDKFIITKCGSLEWLCKELNITYGKYNRNGVREDNLYFQFVKYCYKNEIKNINIELLFHSENGYEVLKKELEILSEHFGKKDCLNNNNIPYIPKTIHAKKGSNWLTQNEYLNIMKLLKKYEY